MLSSHFLKSWRSTAQPRHQSERGVVLILALIVLVALTLAAVALTRSVGTSNVVAGNIAFQQAATHSADRGVETAVAWLEQNSIVNGTGACAGTTALGCTQTAEGYQAVRTDPAGDQDWNAFFQKNLTDKKAKSLPRDETTGNTVSYLVQRMCEKEGEANTDLNSCATSPFAAAGSCPGGTTCTGGGGRGGTGSNVNSSKQTYYRITVFVSGPRNTQSLVQAVVAL
ncbi:UNVERIFIED_ORG: Tfp pilus assembly protein PilX [Variovorax paradoxus]|nr:Tfp pilus assembly protein PilX [Variovorax paradoxus]